MVIMKIYDSRDRLVYIEAQLQLPRFPLVFCLLSFEMCGHRENNDIKKRNEIIHAVQCE